MQFDWFTFVAQLVNFVLLLLLLRRFLFSPIQRAMRRREEAVAARLKAAEVQMADAERAQAQWRAHQDEAGQPVERVLSTPGSIVAITALVQDLLLRIERWRADRATDRILLVYCQPLAGMRYQPHSTWLLPLDPLWLQELQRTAWPSRVLPTFTMPVEQLFSQLVRQHLFVTLYRACAEALATENVSRLVAMQNAEKNIEDHLVQLNARFHHQRQQMITTELLDIVAGYEAVAGP